MDSKEISRLGKQNIGFKHERTQWEFSEMEKALSEYWQEENIARSWINFGYGSLQDLFFSHTGNFFRPHKMETRITNRDRFIVATVIQWLGTNCGRGFLIEAFQKAGYRLRIEKIEK